MIVREGFLITLEGGEGVGKSTLAALLSESLRAQGFDVLLTREPGGTPSADLIREIFSTPHPDDSLTSRAELLLVLAARAQHTEQLILPALAAGQLVICDRYNDSTRVYQGATLGKTAETELEALIHFASRGVEGDLTFYLDIDADTARSRLLERTQGDPDLLSRFDSRQVSFHRAVRQAYRKLAANPKTEKRLIVLDANAPPAVIKAAALGHIATRLGLSCTESIEIGRDR